MRGPSPSSMLGGPSSNRTRCFLLTPHPRRCSEEYLTREAGAQHRAWVGRLESGRKHRPAQEAMVLGLLWSLQCSDSPQQISDMIFKLPLLCGVGKQGSLVEGCKLSAIR